MKQKKFYTIRMTMAEKEMLHLIKSLEKSGGIYSESMLRLIKSQKERQDKEYEKA